MSRRNFAGLAGGRGRRIRVAPAKEEPKPSPGQGRGRQDEIAERAAVAAALVQAQRGAAFAIEREVAEQFAPQLTEETRRRFPLSADEIDARRPVRPPD